MSGTLHSFAFWKRAPQIVTAPFAACCAQPPMPRPPEDRGKQQ